MCYNMNKENLEEFMMDWNGDGKYDRHDEDYFYNYVEENKKNNGTNSNSKLANIATYINKIARQNIGYKLINEPNLSSDVKYC